MYLNLVCVCCYDFCKLWLGLGSCKLSVDYTADNWWCPLQTWARFKFYCCRINLTVMTFRAPLQRFYWINWLNLSQERRREDGIHRWPICHYLKFSPFFEYFSSPLMSTSELLTLEKSPVWGILTESDGRRFRRQWRLERLARVRDTGRKCWYKAALVQRQASVAL